MDQNSLPRCSYFCAVLFALGIGAMDAGCGGAEPLPDHADTADTSFAIVGDGAFNRSSLYGVIGGSKSEWNPIGVTTPVSFVTTYSTSTLIYGIELKWGTATKLYGVTNSLDPQTMDCTDDPIMEIKACTDSDGVLTGLRFKTVSNASPSPLLIGKWCGSDNEVAFSSIDDVLTNMQTWSSPINNAIWGLKFIYTGPANRQPL